MKRKASYLPQDGRVAEVVDTYQPPEEPSVEACMGQETYEQIWDDKMQCFVRVKKEDPVNYVDWWAYNWSY